MNFFRNVNLIYLQRLVQLCRCLILSMSSKNVHHSFASVMLSKNLIQTANRFIISLYSLIPVVANKLQVKFETFILRLLICISVLKCLIVFEGHIFVLN